MKLGGFGSSSLGRITRVFTAVAMVLSVTPREVPASGTPYSGEQIFSGIFFGQAPVSALFPEIYANPAFSSDGGLTQTQIAMELRNKETELNALGETELANLAGETATILETNPGLPTNPATALNLDPTFKSGVLASIASADPTFFSRFGSDMQSGNPVLVRGAMIEAAELYLDAWAVNTTLPPPGGRQSYDTGVVVAVALVAIAAAVVAIAVATVAIVVTNDIAHPGGGTLAFDQAVALFAARLGPPPTIRATDLGRTATILVSLVMMGLGAGFILRRIARA